MTTPLRPMDTMTPVEVCCKDVVASEGVPGVFDSNADVVLANPVGALPADIGVGVVLGGGEGASVVVGGAEASAGVVVAGAEVSPGMTIERTLEGRWLTRATGKGELAGLAEGGGREWVACLATGDVELELGARLAGTAAGADGLGLSFAGGGTVAPLERFGR